MKIKLILVTLIFFIIPNTVLSYTPQEGQVSLAVGALIYQTPQQIQSLNYKSPVRGALGFHLTGDISSTSSIDLAFFMLNKSYIREESGFVTAEEVDTPHIAIGYRRHLASILSTGLAIYSAYSAGDIRTTHLSQANTASVETSARDTVEYGFDFSLMAEIFEFKTMSVVTDLRYSYSITPRPNEDPNQMSVLIGLRYQLQEGHSPAKLENKE